MKQLLPILLCTVAMYSAGCASNGISLENFGGRSDIPKGEKAEIYWSFKHADSVIIKGFSTKFAPTDKVSLSPEKTTTYRIVGYNNSGDSLAQEWTVNVYAGSLPQGQDHKVAVTAPESFLTHNHDSAAPTYLRQTGSANDKTGSPYAMRIVKSRLSGNKHILRAVVMDDNGTFVGGLGKQGDNVLEWKIKVGCDGTSKEILTESVNQFDPETNNRAVALSLCLDRSENMDGIMDQAFQGTRAFVTSLPATDYVNLITFNQTLTQTISYADAGYARDFFTYVQTPKPGGLSAVYRACSRGIANLDNAVSNADISKVVVLITAGADNSSLFLSGSDIASQALQSSTAIYVISLDETSPEQFKLRYIAAATGGKYYSLDKQSIQRLPEILTEITIAQKAYYEITVPKIDNYAEKCASSVLTGALIVPTKTIEDEFMIYPDSEWEQPTTQMLVQFQAPNAEINDEYSSSLQLLAETLQKNPTKIIELVGHTELQEKGDDATAIALLRAQSVRRKLIKSGANPDQIRTRSLSNKKPIYMIEREERHKTINRRVEVRWLDPTLLPYEIEVGTSLSEEDALKQTEQWEQRGVKAYYERIVIDKNPGYIIKLWGYATQDEANTAAKMLRKKYKTEAVVH